MTRNSQNPSAARQFMPSMVDFGASCSPKHSMKLIFVIALALLPGLAQAYCPTRPLSSPDQVSLDTDSVLIVTHASARYDTRFSTKQGLDYATSIARGKGVPLVYLHDDAAEQDYFTKDCAPEYWIFSENGELGFHVLPSHVYVAGGHLEQCLFRTVQDVIFSWSMQNERDLTLTFLMDAIYSSGELVSDSDDYYTNFGAFMRVLEHGRAEDDPWPKITLLQTMGIISQQKQALDYLKRALPDFASAMQPDYRVELQLNNSPVKVLQDMPAWNSPVLKFQFVDSARKL